MYAFIHGAGDVGWYWHMVAAKLRERGHEVVAPDLPIDDDHAGLTEYAEVVVEAIGARRDVIVLAQSFGGYVAPLVCSRVAATLMVLVAGMVPAPGESADDMFAHTGWPGARTSGTIAVFSQKIHPHDSAKLEAIVHLADLEVQSIEAVIADRESIDISHEDMLVPANASQPAQLIARL